MRVLMITCEWPTETEPQRAMFVKRQADALRAHGAAVDVYPFRGGGNPMRYLRHRGQVARRLRETRYDLVHAQWGQSALLALPKRLPLVVTFRGSDLVGFPGPSGRYSMQGRILRRASRMVARIADEVILVSDSLARYLPSRPYALIPSGLDLGLFRPMPRDEARRALGLHGESFLVLF
jgi:hypothetical protein